MKRILGFIFLFAAAQVLAVNPVPYTESVGFSFKITGSGAASMTVYDETGSQYQLAYGNGSIVESSPGVAWLRPGKVYDVQFWGLGSPDYAMSFVAPIGYTVYIDGVAADLSDESPGSGWFLHYHTLEIRPQSAQVGGMWGSFSGIALGKSITWSVGLGDLRTGRSAGAIEFKELDLSNNPASRGRLYYAAPPANVGQIVVVKDGPSNQTLKQIVTPIGFTDVSDLTGGGYIIGFYLWSQAASWNGYYYTFTGNPWKTIKIESPAANQLKITETEGSVVRVSNLVGSGSTTETGGTITYNGNYTVHTFTSNSGGSAGPLVLSSAHSGVSWLVIGGGGGGGSGTAGGGGGAGSMEYLTGQSLSAGSYPVVVGAGGASDANGYNSTFNGTIGYGGGRGASGSTAPGSGGSSGGGCANNNTGAPPTSGSGSNIHWGGGGDNGSYGWRGGGGGGAGQNGHGVGEGASTGYGGDGLANSISGSSVMYCGGGAGGSNTGPGLPGGLGGGGTGVASGVGGNGAANKGAGGAAGDGGAAGGSGGSGVVIVSYPSPTMVWTLQEGDATNCLRTTVHSSTMSSSGTRDDVVTVSTTSGTYAAPTNTVVAKTKYHYVNQAWGEELDSVIKDPDTGGAQLTTTYTYWTTSTDLGNYRRVKSVTAPTGNWTAYEYYNDYDTRGQLKYEYHPFKDTPATVPSTLDPALGRVLYFTYTSDWTGRNTRPTLREERITVSGTTTTVGKTTWSHGDNTGSGEPRAYATINTYRDSTNYQVDYAESYRADADPDYAGEPYQTRSASQAQDSVSISRGTFNTTTKAFTVGSSGDHWRVIHFHGSTSSTGADSVISFNSQSCPAVYMIPYKSTADVTIRIAQGYVYRTETWVYTGSGGWSSTPVVSEDFDYDAHGNLTQRWASNGALTSYTYTNGRLTSTVDPTGIETQYTYDGIGRVASSIKKGASAGTYAAQSDITTANTYNGASNVIATMVSGGSLSQTTSNTYDLAGRLTQTVVPGSYTTGIAYSSGGRVVTTTLPGGATKTTEVYPDGQAKSLTGSAQVEEYYGYRVDSNGYHIQDHWLASSGSAAWTAKLWDWSGRLYQDWRIGGDGSYYAEYNVYNNKGLLDYIWHGDGKGNHCYEYDTLGQVVREGDDLNSNGALDLSSSDRITDYAYYYFNSSGSWYFEKTASVYASASSSNPTLVDKQNWQLSNLSSGRLSSSYHYDVFGNATLSVQDVDRTNKNVTNTVTYPDSSTSEVSISHNSLLVSSRDKTNHTTTYGYDDLGRQTTAVDSRALTATTTYVTGTNQVHTVNDAASGTQLTYDYDSAGRVKSVGIPNPHYGVGGDSRTLLYTYKTYYPSGESYRVWGDTDCPVEYAYDTYGRRITMNTYQGGAGWNQTDWPGTGSNSYSPGSPNTTTWNYQTATGLLNYKEDAAGKQVNYTYKAAGQIATREWARIYSGSDHVRTTYSYDTTTRELTGVTYNDGTPNLTYAYNRLGKIETVVDASCSSGQHRTFNYNVGSGGTLELQSEVLGTGSSDFYANHKITYGYDTTTGTKGRPNALQFGNSTSASADQNISYGYETSTGRFNSLAAGSQTFTYGYQSTSNLIATVTNSGVTYTDTRTYNSAHNWTDKRETTWGSSPATKAKFEYGQDILGRITAITKTGELFEIYDQATTKGMKTSYGYTDRSEVSSETSTDLAGSPTNIAGRQDTNYSYDTIGNRTSVTHNSHTVTYTPNNLNQYDHRDVAGYFDVLGAAPGSTVTVTNHDGSGSPLTASRNGQYFFGAFPLTNTSHSIFAQLDSTDNSTPTPKTGVAIAFLAKTPEAFGYDYDGNMTSDGRWLYTYDAENRLIQAETDSSKAPSSMTRQKLIFSYDYLGRRISKTVQDWNGSAYGSAHVSLRYVYNGWNLMAELDHLASDAVVRSYYWGLDLSGTMQGAGGVGGLVMAQGAFYNSETTATDSGKTLIAVYDALGNLHGMLNTASVPGTGGSSYSAGSLVAGFEYDAFGQTLCESGPYAGAIPFRYSTKYTDLETSLIYYGRRYYSPTLGRFINKDPIEEQGGLNLYGFCGNNGVNRWDLLGQDPIYINGAASQYSSTADGTVYYDYGRVMTGRSMDPFSGRYPDANSGGGGLLFYDPLTVSDNAGGVMGDHYFTMVTTVTTNGGSSGGTNSPPASGNLNAQPTDPNSGAAKPTPGTVVKLGAMEFPDGPAPTQYPAYVPGSTEPTTSYPHMASEPIQDAQHALFMASMDAFSRSKLDSAPMAMVRAGAVITASVAGGYAAPVVGGAVVNFFRPIAATVTLAAGSPAGQQWAQRVMDFLDQAAPGAPSAFDPNGAGGVGFVVANYEDALGGYEETLNHINLRRAEPPQKK